MKYIPDDYGERCRFDAFCKTVLRHEAMNYFRELNRQRKRAIQFSALCQYEMDKLCSMDEYPSDSFVSSAFGYALHIRDELVADTFASLPEREQSILILYCVLELTDGEIGTRKRVNELFQAHLICYLVFVKLMLDVLRNLLFVASYCIHIVSSCPKVPVSILIF